MCTLSYLYLDDYMSIVEYTSCLIYISQISSFSSLFGVANFATGCFSFSGPFRGELGTFFEVGQSSRCVRVAQCEGTAEQ